MRNKWVKIQKTLTTGPDAQWALCKYLFPFSFLFLSMPSAPSPLSPKAPEAFCGLQWHTISTDRGDSCAFNAFHPSYFYCVLLVVDLWSLHCSGFLSTPPYGVMTEVLHQPWSLEKIEIIVRWPIFTLELGIWRIIPAPSRDFTYSLLNLPLGTAATRNWGKEHKMRKTTENQEHS